MMMATVEILKSASIILAAISIILGIRAWKREFIGKRKIRLAEDALMLFYQARDAIREIRNPFGSVGEGGTRKKAENETKDETDILNKAYVVFERYNKREEIFNKLQSTRYQFMARFGRDTEKPFTELNNVLKDIFIAAQMLGSYYWKRQGRASMNSEEFKKHLDDMIEHEATFWFMGEEKDQIGKRVEGIISDIEKITRDTLTEKEIWFKKIF
jgi:CRISPR/Cas system CSM-associated protein Csm2 small subunit